MCLASSRNCPQGCLSTFVLYIHVLRRQALRPLVTGMVAVGSMLAAGALAVCVYLFTVDGFDVAGGWCWIG